MSERDGWRTTLTRLASVAVAVGIWLAPIPGGLSHEAWHLFAIFGANML